MIKRLLLSSFVVLVLFGIVFPAKKENTDLFDYCFSLEKILIRNSLNKRKKLLMRSINIQNELTRFGVNKTKGSLINKIINQYKNSREIFVVNLIPNNIYCFAGYWIEEIKPGIFEAIFYEKSKQKIDELNNVKDEVNEFIKGINSEYKNIKKELNGFF